MGRCVLITGGTGQDGSYLSEYLLEKDYDVHLLIRPSSSRLDNLKAILDLVTIHYGDITDHARLIDVINDVKPKEIYNLCAMSHVGKSFNCPLLTAEVNGLGAHKLFDAAFKVMPEVKIYQASTSEMYGDVVTESQDETTRFDPVSPYGISKLYAHMTAQMYRRRGYFISCGILFNHESPRRDPYFVTRKICKGIKNIDKKPLKLGNLDASRDWGYAPDYVRGMHAMLQHKTPDDFVLATGKTFTVRNFCDVAFKLINRPITWWGHGKDEKGVDRNGITLVEIDEQYYRPSEIGRLCGNAKKAQMVLGWKPNTIFRDLVKIMLEAELKN